MAVEDAGIVDGDFLFLAGSRVHAFLNERLGDGGHILDAPVEPDSGVDAVGEQVTGHATACCCGVEAPKAFTALREVGADGPVL